MKVLIIALPRTGSTSLLSKIGKEKSLTEIYEPYGIHRLTPYESWMDGVVVKTIIEQVPTDENWKDWILNLIQEFDEVILLSRKDLKACAESHAFSVWYSNTNKLGYKFNSNIPYLWQKTPNYEICENNVYRWNTMIHSLSNKLNIPMTYYEDIYDLKSKDKLRLGNKDNLNNII